MLNLKSKIAWLASCQNSIMNMEIIDLMEKTSRSLEAAFPEPGNYVIKQIAERKNGNVLIFCDSNHNDTKLLEWDSQ